MDRCKTSRVLKRPLDSGRTARPCLLALVLFLLVAAGGSVSGAPARKKVTILQTTDLHGSLLPWDYARGREESHGLARVATRIRAIRKEVPGALLLDAGDTIQGSPLEYLHARRPNQDPDPMALAMSALGYDAMSVGNHEFNFGLEVLRKAQRESGFPWLSANTLTVADGKSAFPEYVLKTVDGVRVGILGLTTPNIPGWEPERNRPGLRWEDPADTARRLVPILTKKERCDVVVVLIHSGPEIDLATGESNGTENENRVAALARQVPGIDLLLTGHTHRKIPLTRLNGVPVVQPGRWGDFLARVDLELEKKGGRWRPVAVTGDLLPSDATVATDPEIARIAIPYHEAARAYLDEELAVLDEGLPADRARLEDSALLDFVNDTQLALTGADLSMTSLLPGGRYEGLPRGKVTVRDVYALYPYENQLAMVEVDGAILKASLEHAAEFYGNAVLEGGRLVLRPKEGMIPYSYDVLEGASYRIDPLAPVGSRIKDLAFRGRPVQPRDRFTLALNAYRAQGAGGYVELRQSKTVKVFSDEIRELLIERLRQLKKLEPKVNRNWIVAPDVTWAEGAFARRPGQ